MKLQYRPAYFELVIRQDEADAFPGGKGATAMHDQGFGFWSMGRKTDRAAGLFSVSASLHLHACKLLTAHLPASMLIPVTPCCTNQLILT